jgi:uncharacterized protein with PIN domain
MADRNGTPGNDTLTGTASADSLFGLGGNDSLLGLGGNDSLFSGTGNDRLFGGTGNDRLFGGNSDDTLRGDEGNDSLDGGTGSDRLFGGSGSDTLTGSTSNAIGEIDILTGGLDTDLFVLGDANTVFYDDRNIATAGRGDYALITDFTKSDFSNGIEDVIQLNGTKEDYVLAASPTGLPSGIAIYRNKPTGELDELIGIVQGSTNLSLNGGYFRFTEAGAGEFNLSDLNSTNGIVINGIDTYDSSGDSVSSAGDVNGDGFDDIIIGAVRPDPNSQNFTVSSYVVFGKAGGLDASLNLSELDGTNGFVVNGIDAGGYADVSVSNAGDVNSDGFDDIIIGANNANPNGQNFAGASYVVFGKVGKFDASLNVSDLNGTNGFVVNGINAGGYSGVSVSSAGDVNGDGFDDLIIGAKDAAPNGQDGAGASYVVFGKIGAFDASLNPSDLNGTNGFVVNGINEFDRLGESVSFAGDVNGDGFDDLIIGAYGANPNSQESVGASYLVFGKASGFDASLNLSDLNGTNGFVINGINEGDGAGRSVSSAGDVNSDGFDDILISARNASPFNGEDFAGESYLVFGKASNFDASLNLSDLNGTNGFVINGINERDFSGSVSSAGDVNSDGFDDIIIGTAVADPNGQESAGESYLVFGKASGFDASLNLFDLNGTNGFVINGINEDDGAGTSVSGAGDVNGDGFDDLTVGAPGADPNGQSFAGESYVIFGRDFTGSVTNAGTANNDTLTGTASDDILVGGLGNDRLIGGGGIDVLYGGAGNDTLSFGAIDRRLNGGSGVDTLRIDGRDNIDLTTISNNKFTAFEIIDITGTGNNSLAFTRLDLLDLSDTTNRLIVNGNAGDKVTSTGQGWTLGGTTTVDSVLYRQYTSGAATLLVDADITQTIT